MQRETRQWQPRGKRLIRSFWNERVDILKHSEGNIVRIDFNFTEHVCEQRFWKHLICGVTPPTG